MTKEQGVIVICSYRPKPGQADAMKALIREHVPALRKLGLATDRPAIHMQAADGTLIEIFEWVSEDASRGAHENPKVQELWERYAALCEFVPMADVPETAKPFAHFTPF
jgi:quinol monooxygenase YgiN